MCIRDRIAWDAFEQLIRALGLEPLINVPALKELSESVEDTIENPNELIKEVTGVDV